MKFYSIIQKRAISGSSQQPRNNKRNHFKKFTIALALIGLGGTMSAQEEPIDSLEGEKVVLDEVLVQGVRATTYREMPLIPSPMRCCSRSVP